MSNTKRYHDEDWLRQQYCDENRSTYDIADECGVEAETIRRWLEEFAIERDGVGRPEKSTGGKYIYRRENDKQYVQYAVGNPNEGDVTTFYEQQLVAIAEGAEPEKVFSENQHEIHFENDCPLDTRPDNLTLMDAGEHKKLHELEGFH